MPRPLALPLAFTALRRYTSCIPIPTTLLAFNFISNILLRTGKAHSSVVFFLFLVVFLVIKWFSLFEQFSCRNHHHPFLQYTFFSMTNIWSKPTRSCDD